MTPDKILAQMDSSGRHEGHLYLTNYNYPLPAGLTSVGGTLGLTNYKHPLPAGFTGVGGDLVLEGYNYPLPAGLTSVGGTLDLGGYNHPLPAGLTSVGGLAGLRYYNYPLPAGLTSVGGDLYFGGYNHPLPAGLTSVGGYINLSNYNHPLPAGLTSVGGLNLYGYNHPLPPGLTSVGGKLALYGYNHPLPVGLTSVGGDLEIRAYNYPLPAGLTSVGGILWLRGYDHPLPAGLTSVGQIGGLGHYNHPLPARLTRVGGGLHLGGYRHPLPAGLKSVRGNLNLSGYNHPMPEKLIVGGDIIGAESYPFALPKDLKQEHYDLPMPKSQAFRDWFGSSHVVDDKDEPRVVYHGTNQGGFSAFDPKKIDPHHPGFYFSDDVVVAATYVSSPQWPLQDPTPPAGSVDKSDVRGAYRLFLSLKNPAILDCESSQWNDISHPEFPGLHHTYEIAAEAKKRGYDGVIFRNLYDHGGVSGEEKLGTVYVAFEPTQIKSALFNQGTYDPKDPDMRKNPQYYDDLESNPDIIERSVESLDDRERGDVFDLIQTAYAHVGGHGNVRSEDDLYEFDRVIMADTDGDGRPNVAILAGTMRNGTVKVSVFATDGSPEAKGVLLAQAKAVLMKRDWWAELPKEFASFLATRGVPMVEDQITAMLLLGRRINPSNFTWHGEIPRHTGSGYYERSYFGSEPQTRAIMGNVTPEMIDKIKKFVAREAMSRNPSRAARRTSRRKTSRSKRKTSRS